MAIATGGAKWCEKFGQGRGDRLRIVALCTRMIASK